jgi:hypothetical protein
MRRIEGAVFMSLRIWHEVVVLLILALLLAGCSAFAPVPKPADFPFHEAAAILENGESILTLMLEKGLGVSRTPLHLYEERPDELIGPTEQQREDSRRGYSIA